MPTIVILGFTGYSQECKAEAVYVGNNGDEAAKATRYELRLPLAVVGIESGAEFGLNFTVYDDDNGKGQRCWFELGPGMTWPFKPELYPRFVLGK